MVALARAGLGRVDMVAELQQARVNSPMVMVDFDLAYDLFCQGRDAEAGDVAQGSPDHPRTGRLCFLVALGRRDGRADARRACKAMVGPNRWEAAPLLFAVGSPDEVAALARDLRATADQFPYRGPYSAADQAAMLAFLEGSAAEADLLGRPMSNEYERCRRNYLIGWKRLGAGPRDGARAAFQEAYEVMQVSSTDWMIARAVLIRMKDPDWPQAIPKK